MGNKRDPTELVGPKRSIVPWVLLLAVLGGTGYAYWTLYRPLAEELEKKQAEANRLALEQKRAGDTASAAQADLQNARDELKRAKEDLVRSASQQTEDQKLLEKLKKEVGGGADVQDAGGQITVTMVDKILFRSGQAELTPAGQEVLRKLGGVLAGVDKLIEVGGHADNLPVESDIKELYPTNWELSAARATNVVRFLVEEVAIKPRRLKAAGFGSYRPVASNATEKGRAKNRRIEILLLPDRIKVVKGDFSDELAAAAAKPAPAATSKQKGTTPPKLTDKERAKAVAAMRAKQAPKKR
jgi:chemotaxis protein MotB